ALRAVGRDEDCVALADSELPRLHKECEEMENHAALQDNITAPDETDSPALHPVRWKSDSDHVSVSTRHKLAKAKVRDDFLNLGKDCPGGDARPYCRDAGGMGFPYGGADRALLHTGTV